MAQRRQLATSVSGSTAPGQTNTVDNALDRLGQTIADRRRALARHTSRGPQSDDDWDAMVRAHRASQLEIESTGTVTAQLIEGLRFDLDILKHAFRRWVVRVDRIF
jgi:hypothetical protein